MMTQTTMFDAAPTSTIAVGDTVRRKLNGAVGVVREIRDDYAQPMFVVVLEDRTTAILKFSEVTSVSAHALSWTCGCESCVAARKMLGRAFTF